METSDEMKNMIQALVKVQGSLEPIKKDRVNPFAGSSYATLDAILGTLLPLLSENGIAITQEPVMESTQGSLKIGVETTLLHITGEYVVYEPFFMELEKGSKMNMAQSAGSIITYAKRYAISSIFGISTDEDKDGVQNNKQDNHNQQNNKPYNQPETQQKAQPVTEPQKDFIKKLAIEYCTARGMMTNEAYKELTEVAYRNSGFNDIEKATYQQAVNTVKYLQNLLKAEEEKQKEKAIQQGSILENGTTTASQSGVDWGK